MMPKPDYSKFYVAREFDEGHILKVFTGEVDPKDPDDPEDFDFSREASEEQLQELVKDAASAQSIREDRDRLKDVIRKVCKRLGKIKYPTGEPLTPNEEKYATAIAKSFQDLDEALPDEVR